MTMRVAITGATGMLGRDLLGELVRNHLDHPEGIEVFVLGRGEGGRSLRQRLDALADDCAEYARVPRERRQDVAALLARIRCVEMDLRADHLEVAADDLARLRRGGIDHFFHLAALTDFRSTPQVAAALRRVNVDGTRRLLALADDVGVRQFAYVGTAYSAGITAGRVDPDQACRDGRFRNPYERTKDEAERHVRRHAAERGLRVRCFRPSTICGRLLEAPDGAIGAFKVFYGWGAYFLRLKARALGLGPAGVYDAPLRLQLRALMNREAGLNVVPVDFAAKAIWAACLDEAPGDSFHVVNDAETPHVLLTEAILRLLRVEGVRPVASMPGDLNAAESAYYRTVGKIFTPYLTNEPIHFATESIRPILDRHGLRCPTVDGPALARLLEFARRRHFGVELAAPSLRDRLSLPGLAHLLATVRRRLWPAWSADG